MVCNTAAEDPTDPNDSKIDLHFRPKDKVLEQQTQVCKEQMLLQKHLSHRENA